MSFTKGAEELLITQPAVTAQIKALEEYCNFKLFQRQPRKLYLTPEGESLYELSKIIFEYEQELERSIEEMRELKTGVLRLGAAKTYARYFMPHMICLYKESYKGVNVRLNEGSSMDMVRQILNFKIDLAIIAKVEENPDIEFIPFSREELVPIVSPDHPRVNSTVSLASLAQDPMIMKESGSGTRRVVSETFLAAGLTPKVLLETSSADMIKQLVQRGEGYTFLSRAAVIEPINRGELGRVYLEEGDITLDVYIVHLKGPNLSLASQSFNDLLFTLIAEDKDLPTIDELKNRVEMNFSRSEPCSQPADNS